MSPDLRGFEGYLKGRGLSVHTIRAYLRWVREALEWQLDHGHDLLGDPTPTSLAGFADSLPKSHASRGQAVAALRHWYEAAGIYTAPLRAIRVPPSPEMVCKAVEPSEARDLVKVSVGWWPQGAAVLAGLFLALRREEIAAMEWERFDDELGWYTVTGKYDKTATLPVHPVLAGEYGPRRGTGWVFPGRVAGRHVSAATVWEWVRKVGEAVGLDGLRTHQLRHTALATANDATGDLRSVQTFARHVKPTTTSGYTRTTTTRLRATVDSLDYLSE